MNGDPTDHDVLLARLADEFAARYRRGERPTLYEYLERYPALADDLRELLPALIEVEQAKDDRAALAPPATAPLPPLQQLGDFRILREIGRGGMGVVYEAEQLSLGRRVALKVLPAHHGLGETEKRRFEREARAAAKLHHTNIVPVFAVGEHDGLPYYAMQFIQGLGLDLVIDELRRLQLGGTAQLHPDPRATRKDVSAAQVAQSLLGGRFSATVDVPQTPADAAAAPGPSAEGCVGSLPMASVDTALTSSRAPVSTASAVLPGPSSGQFSSRAGKHSYWKSVAQVGIQVAEALAYAHDQGVLHRDIKPSNLLLDTHGTVWITDFGLAKVDDRKNLTHHGDIIGTLRYMPPEAFSGNNEPHSDIYSLGLTLYELLALRPAFNEVDRNRLIHQVTHSTAQPLDRLNRGIPRDLATIVHKAIDSDPNHRYATARALADDLRRFCVDEAILARRPSSLEHLRRWARHHPGLAASLSILAVLLVSITISAVLAADSFRRMAVENLELAQQRDEQRHEAEWGHYRASLAAAGSALRLGNAKLARLALEEAPPRFRNWEWQHFHQQLDGARTTFARQNGRFPARGHVPVCWPAGTRIAAFGGDDRIHLWDIQTGVQLMPEGQPANLDTPIALSPDGGRLVGGALDGLVYLWDARTGKRLAVMPGPHGRYYQAVFSPDGRRLLTRHETTQVLWDATTGKKVAEFAEGSPGSDVAFSPDSSKLAIGFGDALHVVDANSGAPLTLTALPGGFQRFVFSPDNRRIAAAPRKESTPRLYDGTTGKEIAVLHGHLHSVYILLFSPDGTCLATASNHPDSTVRLFDGRTGQPRAVLRGHTNSPNQLAFHPDGTRLASASDDQTGRIWDTATGQAVVVLRDHVGPVINAPFSADGSWVATASHDHTVRLWDAHSGALIRVLLGHGAPVIWVAFADHDALLISWAMDGEVRVWDLKQAEQHGSLRGHTGFVYDVAFHPDGRHVASAAWDHTVRVWNLDSGRQTAVLHHDHYIVGGVAWHPDGKRLAAADRSDHITLWDVGRGRKHRVLTTTTDDWQADIRPVFNRDGSLLAAGDQDGRVRLWDVASGKLSAEWLTEPGPIRAVAFHPDGTRLASTCFDGTIRVWELATHAPLAILRGHPALSCAVAYSADGAWLASAAADGVRLWDANRYEERAFLQHAGKVYDVAFHPSGTRLATACADNTIRLWDVATHKEVAELHGHAGYVHALAWSPDGTRLVSASGDHTVRIWDSLSAAERAQRDTLPAAPPAR